VPLPDWPWDKIALGLLVIIVLLPVLLTMSTLRQAEVEPFPREVHYRKQKYRARGATYLLRRGEGLESNLKLRHLESTGERYLGFDVYVPRGESPPSALFLSREKRPHILSEGGQEFVEYTLQRG